MLVCGRNIDPGDIVRIRWFDDNFVVQWDNAIVDMVLPSPSDNPHEAGLLVLVESTNKLRVVPIFDVVNG